VEREATKTITAKEERVSEFAFGASSGFFQLEHRRFSLERELIFVLMFA
jgi:hypothetical protein